MKLAEIRDLDGPNLFMLKPAIKVELKLEPGEKPGQIADRIVPGTSDLTTAATQFLREISEVHNVQMPDVVVREMDDPACISIVFSWERRSFAMAIAQHMVDTINGVVDDNTHFHLVHALGREATDEFASFMREEDRSAIAIAVTGTNGKTTTTRLIAHLMRTAGYLTGWNSSSGIYIEGEVIEEGDYSGPSGARRILEDPSVQVAVLETARGGILLRGLGYEHNDVSVFTNVSADHLDLQGVKTLQTLAEVKAVVCRVTRSDGCVVVNADDQLVMHATDDVVAPRTLVTQDASNPLVTAHLERGGRALLADGDAIQVRVGEHTIATFAFTEIPMTHNGRARHMVENAMCAIGAALAVGLGESQIRTGLHSFRGDSNSNLGRMNVYRCGDIAVVLDYAHNEAGLKHLIEFGKGDLGPDGHLITIIGTAGDRTEHSLSELGRIAAESSDLVIAKDTARYLRGRSSEELLALYRKGAEQFPNTPYLEAESETAALEIALKSAKPGDVIVLMAQEQLAALTDRLARLAC